jgi:hypothetical protein
MDAAAWHDEDRSRHRRGHGGPSPNGVSAPENCLGRWRTGTASDPLNGRTDLVRPSGTEHILLGLLREDDGIVTLIPEKIPLPLLLRLAGKPVHVEEFTVKLDPFASIGREGRQDSLIHDHTGRQQSFVRVEHQHA